MINYLIEANLVFSILYLLMSGPMKYGKWFEMNRVGYVIVPVVAAIAPLLSINILSQTQVSSVFQTSLSEIAVSVNTAQQGSSSLVLAILEYGVIIATFYGISAILRAIYQLKKNSFTSVDGYYLNEEGTESFSFFNYIFLKKGLIGEEREIILHHEKYHARKLHSIDIIFIRLLQGVFLINPLYYMLYSSAKLNHEYLADKYASSQFGKASYASCLIAQSLSGSASIIHHTFSSQNQSTSFKRLNMLNAKNQHKMKKLIYLLLVPALLITIIGVSCKAEKVKEGSVEITEAQYPGGEEVMLIQIQTSVKYPKESIENNEQGKSYVKFLIGADGYVKNPVVTKSSGSKLLDEEAVRVIMDMPQWVPAVENGKPVESEFTIPIHFRLG